MSARGPIPVQPSSMSANPESRATRSFAGALFALMRPKQWAKSVFVMIGPMYGLADGSIKGVDPVLSALAAAASLALVSSAFYIVNDVIDAPRDRAHPRKRLRPIASGEVSPQQGVVLGVVLIALAIGLLVFVEPAGRLWTGLIALVYGANVLAYSAQLKRIVVADVMSLSLGFVLRVLAGCAAVAISPTSWLLNVTFFLAMFLAFGKRLGERRTLGEQAVAARGVQAGYTDDILRLAVVVTAVVTLVTYAGYVQAQESKYILGFNLLWLTMLPATYALLRCIVLVERGEYDDPTELAGSDRPFQAAAAVFAAMTISLMLLRHAGHIGHSNGVLPPGT